MKGGDESVTQTLRRSVLASVIATLLGLGLLAGCTSQAPQEKGAEPVAEYANPDFLTNTDWLASHLDDEGLVLLDVRTPEEYGAGHIKGAVNLPVHSTDVTISGVGGLLAAPEKVAAMFGERGIGSDSKVVVYDGQITPPAGRMFWILEYLGHKDASVLNGGLAKWKKEGREVTKEVPKVEKATFTVALSDGALATKDEVRASMGKKNTVLVDTRPTLEWMGGHLEGARRMDWVELLTKDDPPLMKPAAQLDQLFADQGITKDIDTVLY